MAVRYEKAPITEALIDIRVELSPSVTVEDLRTLHGHVSHDYPKKEDRYLVQGQFSIGTESGATTKQQHIGFAFRSEDGKKILQSRLDGFTFSRLAPYGTWSELRDESQRLWALYCDVVKPLKVVRVAVRYINQINIPSERADYKDYFRTTPEVSPDLQQDISSFFMQLHFPQIDFGGMLILTQSTTSPTVPGTIPVILDLDAFRLDPNGIAWEEIWNLLEVLRYRKNQFFEGSITERTRTLFGHREEY
jgi:uncharacterized protein (TIGR04255 family)